MIQKKEEDEESSDNDLDELNVLTRPGGVIRGITHLVFFLRSMGVRCHHNMIKKVIRLNPSLREKKEGHAFVYTNHDVNMYIKAITKMNAKDLVAERKKRLLESFNDWQPDHDAVRALGSMFLGCRFDLKRKLYTPVFGQDGEMFQTRKGEVAREWFEPIDGNNTPWEIIQYTKAIELHTDTPKQKTFHSSCPEVMYEPHHMIAWYSITSEGRYEASRIPSEIYFGNKLEGRPRFVSAVIPPNWPTRRAIARYAADGDFPVCVLWSRGVFVSIGTLDPDPRTRLQKQIAKAAICRGTRRSLPDG